METKEKRNPPLSVGDQIVIDVCMQAGLRDLPRPDNDLMLWLANRITEAVNAARHGVTVEMVDSLIEDARSDGWECDQGSAAAAQRAADRLAATRSVFLQSLGIRVDAPPQSP